MSLLDYKITSQDIAEKGVIAAPDRLIGNAENNKRIFDRLIREAVSGLFNGLIDALGAETGAGEIGTEEIEGLTGTDIQTVLESLKILADSKEGSAEAAAALLLKADKTETAQHIKGVSFNAQTGVFTFTRQNGQTVTFDTLLEKLAVNFSYDTSTQELVLTLADGTVQRISLSAFITEAEFTDSDQIDFSVSNHVVTATIKAGSITDAMLSSGLVELLQGYVSTAAASATAAAGSASAAAGSAASAEGAKQAAVTAQNTAVQKAGEAEQHKTAAEGSATEAAGSATDAENAAAEAESWAVGGTGTRTGEDTNNSKYWCQQAQQAAGGGVTSFNGRSGIVLPQSGDYDAEDVGADPAGSAAAVQTELQSQIDAIVSKADVVDIVEVYDRGVTSKTDIVHYDTSALFANDVVKVMQDETHSNAIAYYKWSGTAWSYVGSQGPYYTKGETDTLLAGKAAASHNHTLENITNADTVQMVVTFSDDTTATYEVVVKTS